MIRHGLRIAAILTAVMLPLASTQASSFAEGWYMKRGRANMKIGDYRAAAEAFQKVTSQNPQHREALLLLAEAYERQGLRDKAVEVLDQYLQVNPGDASVAFRQAQLLASPEFAYRRQDAYKYFEIGLKARDDAAVRLRYAKLLGEKQETSQEAAKQFEFVLQKQPKNAEAHFGAAQAYAWHGQMDKALEHANAAVKLNPRLRGLQAFRADLAKASSATAADTPRVDPIVTYQKAYEEDPGNLEALLRLARTYKDRGRAEEAITLYRKYLSDHPAEPTVAFSLAETLRASADIDQRRLALRYYEKGLDIVDIPRMRVHYADVLGEHKETLTEAIEQYRLVLEKQPTQGEAHFGLARALAWQGKLENAYAELQLAERYEPNQEGLADFRRKLLNSGVAQVEPFWQAFQQNPDSPRAALALARAYAKRGEDNKALETLDQFSKSHPPDADISFQIAQWMDDSPQHAQAASYYARGLELRDDPAMRLRYAQLLGERQTTSAEAAKEFERVLEKQPRNASAHLGAAKAFSWSGNNDRALYHARQAARYRPESDEAQELLAELRRGREPALGIETNYFNQGGTNYGLEGFTSDLATGVNLRQSLRLSFGVGGLYYRDGNWVGGGRGLFKGSYLTEGGYSLAGEFRYTKLGPDTSAATGSARWGVEGQTRHWHVGFERELVYDSFLSLVGRTLNRRPFGAARSNLFFADGGIRWLIFDVHGHPYAGWTEARSLDPNLHAGIVAGLDAFVIDASSLSVTVGYQANITHYNEDQSGFQFSRREPLPGGYFSPHLFIEQMPKLTLRTKGLRWDLSLGGGPSYQYVKDRDHSKGTSQTGGHYEVVYVYRFADHWSTRINPAYMKIANVYSRFTLTGSVDYRF